MGIEQLDIVTISLFLWLKYNECYRNSVVTKNVIEIDALQCLKLFVVLDVLDVLDVVDKGRTLLDVGQQPW